MSSLKVSIICVCYNHLQFLEEAIRSAFAQDYENKEIIVIDDASTDGSQDLLLSLQEELAFNLLINEKNLGNCATFNKAFKQSQGDYIIDLSTDDVLLPQHVTEGVNEFKQLSENYGVVFCDHQWIDEKGKFEGRQYRRNKKDKLDEVIPTGDVYVDLLEKYYISAPTMIIRREVLEELNGYDESLSYEDFDFWVRSSRDWKYHFSDRDSVKKRRLKDSLSRMQFRFSSKHDRSTYTVCEKAFKLNRSDAEQKALKRRVQYELKHALANGNLRLANDYRALMGRIEKSLGS